MQCLVTWSSHRYFYPRPPRGGRPSAAGQHAEPDRFLSTPSARRATPRPQKWPWYKKFLSTPSARRATPPARGWRTSYRHFYPRPPRGGRRSTVCWPTASPRSDFYPRPPRGGRPPATPASCAAERFLSTPSARRATPSRHFLLRADAYFYPRPPRGGRQPGLAGRKDISYFYPRPPRGGRRLGQTGRATQFPISIYALREEGDRTLTGKWPKARAFLSTPSARRATVVGGQVELRGQISIHALREEGDPGITSYTPTSS